MPVRTPRQRRILARVAPEHFVGRGEQLRELTALKTLSLGFTKVSDAGIKELEQLLNQDTVIASRIFGGIIRTLSRRLRQADEGIRNLFQRMVYY